MCPCSLVHLSPPSLLLSHICLKNKQNKTKKKLKLEFCAINIRKFNYFLTLVIYNPN